MAKTTMSNTVTCAINITEAWSVKAKMKSVTDAPISTCIKQAHKGYVIPAEYALSKRPSFLSTANAIAVKAMAFRNTTLEL